MKKFMNETAMRLKDRRVAMGMSQTTLSEKSGVSARTIIKIEQGVPAQVGTILAICKVLGMSLNVTEKGGAL